jgi:sterol desaturase/sphingolipid hydroxylase (fatty acid hydroxylase superfamily)
VSGGLLAHVLTIRIAAFVGLFALFSISEALWPARPRDFRRLERWPANLFLAVLDTAVLRFLFPLLAVGAALWAKSANIGLFNAAPLPDWVAFAASLLALDATIYGQHVALHRITLLWRFHRVHHTDRNVDVTTALRFHPGETALSMGLKMIVVALLGVPPAAVVAFEVVLNGMAMFSHANLRLGTLADGLLRVFVVTPAMHRIHHSSEQGETDSNYGFNLSLWDRIFGTYRPAARAALFPLGLPSFKNADTNAMLFIMLLPFRKGACR